MKRESHTLERETRKTFEKERKPLRRKSIKLPIERIKTIYKYLYSRRVTLVESGRIHFKVMDWKVVRNRRKGRYIRKDSVVNNNTLF